MTAPQMIITGIFTLLGVLVGHWTMRKDGGEGGTR